jgi:hypothetical protein
LDWTCLIGDDAMMNRTPFHALPALLAAVLLAGGIGGREACAQRFEPVDKMTEGRFGSRATLLADGTVLITGGLALRPNSTAILASAERFDPKTHQFTVVGKMAERRNDGHAAVRLPDGRVLVVGGTLTKTAELYDPTTGRFRATGNMLRMRSGVTATLLADGRVLVAGGWEEKVTAQTAELFDPATEQFAPTGPMAHWRYGHAALRLADGRVMLLGGWDQRDRSSRSIEIYDPKTNTFPVQAEMVEARVAPTAALLPDGRVLIVGGLYANPAGDIGGVRKSVEIFDPTTGRSSIVEGLTDARVGNLMVALPNRQILVAGGASEGHEGPRQLRKTSILSSAEFLDPVSGKSSPAAPMNMGRVAPAAAMLLDGRVLVAGGAAWSDQLVFTDTAEVLVP